MTPTQTSPLGLDKPARLTIVPNYLTFCQIRHKKYGDGDTVYLGAAASSEYFRGGHQAGQKQDFKNFFVVLFIGPKSDHWLPLSVTQLLTPV